MSDINNHWFAVATIIAILAGPVLAVLVTRFTDRHREIRGRQWDIFRNLMRYRRTPLNPEFVGALNLVEVEFASNPKVIQTWKRLLAQFEDISNVSSRRAGGLGRFRHGAGMALSKRGRSGSRAEHRDPDTPSRVHECKRSQ